MSDSTENTNNLDSYGVWVKRPPQDAADTTENAADEVPISSDDSSIDEPVISEDLTEFSIPDDNSALTDDELSDITNDFSEESNATDLPDGEFSADDFLDAADNNSSAESAKPAENESSEMPDFPDGSEIPADDFLSGSDDSVLTESGDGEISLDDFMDGGFTDPNPGAAPSSDSITDEISLDDFFDTDSSSKAKEDDVSNDEPLDIDLSFTESPENEVPVEEVSAEDDDSSIDTQEDDMFDNIEAEKEAKAPETKNFDKEAFENSTEELSLDDFGVGENSDDATAVAAAAAVNSAAESEEVDLSDFGVDSNAGETPVKQDVKAAKKNEQVDYDLAITDDDTVEKAPDIEEVETHSSDSNTTKVDSSVLDMIMKELSGLKNEISSLKGEFETLKNQENSAPAKTIEEEPVVSEENIQEEESVIENPEDKIEEPETFIADEQEEEKSEDNETAFEPEEEIPEEKPAEENTGFFDGNDSDETIALSGDELSNIMNTADFTETESEPENEDDIEIPEELPPEYATSEEENTEEVISEDSTDTAEENTENTAESENIADESPLGNIEETPILEEEPDSGLSMDLNDENLEEPNLEAVSEQLNEENSLIPKADELAEEDKPLDEILLDDSDNDFEDSVSAANAEEQLEEPVPLEDSEPEEETEVENAEQAETETQSEETETSEENSENEENNKKIEDDIFNDYFAAEPTVSEAISDESIDYLKDDETDKNDIEANENDEEIAPVEEEIPEENATEENSVEESKTEDSDNNEQLPEDLKNDVKSVLLYMDQLLENLPEDKIMEFAKSEQFSTYKKLFSELGLS